MLCEMIINVNACNFFVFHFFSRFFILFFHVLFVCFLRPQRLRVRVYIIRCRVIVGDKNKPVCFVLSSIYSIFARKYDTK